jgi:IclR family pca regulon transcriptional regulator
MTLSEVSEKVGLTRATARRFLLTLETLGYVKNVGKDFSLTPKVMELGYSYLSSQGLAGIISPRLAELSTAVHESSSAAILDGNDIVYVARTAGRKIMQVQITIGTRFPAYATSMGRVLLAGMNSTDSTQILAQAQPQLLTPHTKVGLSTLTKEISQVKTQGYSFVDQELELGLRSLAVPIHNRNGRVIAAINVSTTSSTPIQVTLTSLLAPLKKCAESIESDFRLTP